MIDQRPSLIARLLLLRDGRPRPLACALLFRAARGEPRLLFRRTLFKTSGAVRPGLPSLLRRFLEECRLCFWLGEVDPPGAEEATRMAAVPRNVLLVVEAGGAAAIDDAALRASCRSLLGVSDLRVLSWPPGSAAASHDAAGAFAASGPAPVVPPAGPAILLIGGSLPTPHGPWLLLQALKGRAVAYGDEIRSPATDAPGTFWFKPPTFSPLLAAQGVLLDGVVALDLRDGRLRQAWARARTAGWRAALAETSAMLAAAEVAHVARVCARGSALVPEPLPLALPTVPAAPPKVAVIIPTRDGWDHLGPCLASLARTDWPRDRLEVVVIDNGSRDPSCLAGLAATQDAGVASVLRDNRPFNFASLNNAAVRTTDAEVLVFLNDDTRVRRADWLHRLVGFACVSDVGAVGPKMLYGDGTVQHGGVVLGMDAGAVNAFAGFPAEAEGYMGLARLTREVAAVTGACLCLRRSVFEEVGGFDEGLAVAYNDIVLCLDVLAAGYRNIFVAETLLDHLEGRTRGRDVSGAKALRLAQERAAAERRHPDLFRQDPYYSPNLSRRVLYMPHFGARPRAGAVAGADAG